MNLLVSFVFIAILVSPKPTEEIVTALPEMDISYGLYSGYVSLSSYKELHYILAESQNDWKTDPLVIWFDGGPGCSSQYGWSVSNGPWVMDPGETSFKKNPYAWNKNATVLYITQPAGAGYSWCDPSAPEGTCSFDDDITASDNLKFLLGWYDKFPEYKAHDLYISGESYAGIFVPLLSQQISEHNANDTLKSTQINQKGMMVGNGCTDWFYDRQPATNNVTYGRALFNTDIWDKMNARQCDYSGCEFGDNPDEICMSYLDEVNIAIADIDLYQMYLPVWGYTNRFGMCTLEENEKAREQGIDQTETRRPFQAYQFTGDYTPWSARPKKDQYSCVSGDPLTMYFNNQLVREQLHIPSKIQPWIDCNHKIPYVKQKKGSKQVYVDLKGEIRMLFYSGDKDGVVPAFGSYGWIASLNRTEVAPWRAWNDFEEQVGGYFWQLDGLDFSTVHGAGHVVALDQRERAYQLIFNWIQNKPIDPNWATTTGNDNEIIQ